MIRGFMKTSSQTALAVAAAGLLMSTYAPAKAADLGGGCCADLEERVAELEATTARKGNRVVSLQIYGQVNKGLLVWDDGVDSDAFVVDNETTNSRVGVKGKATIKPGLTAGFNMEYAISDANSSLVTNSKTGDDIGADGETADRIQLRQNYWYIESETLGRFSLGHQSQASDGGAEVVLGNSLTNSGVNLGAGIQLRFRDENGVAQKSTSTLADWANNLDGSRDDLIRYDSPSIYGFILSATWGENDFADAALRFKKEFGTIRLAAGVAYVWSSTGDGITSLSNFEAVAGSASVMHVPTGLYVAFAAGSRTFDSDTRTDDDYWYIQGGIEKKWMPMGSTTFYGEYGKYSHTGDNVAPLTGEHDVGEVQIIGSEATRWGFGVNQKIDAAAMDIYAQAQFWSFDNDNTISYDDIRTFMVGSRIQF